MERLRLSHLLLALALFASQTSQAAVEDEDEDVQGYDSIVNQLNREAEKPAQASRMKASTSSRDPFETVWIHFGAGLATLYQSVSFNDGSTVYLGQKGVQAALGIDLFSPNWAAETTYRSFGESNDSRNRVSLQEFELKLFFKNRLAPQMNLKVGGGLSGRYMSVMKDDHTQIQYTTPSSVGTLGFDIFMNQNVSFGGEASVRSAMITDTPDQMSFDATLRLDTHF